jgi:hypothetical protein
MLQTDDRVLLREAIRPPDGYELDEGIVTTYSLDLLSLLTIPLYFTLFEVEGEDASGAPDHLALLQALRRHAARLSVYCQAGEIAVPARQQQLYGYLESSVVEVKSPRPNGVFHPKVWALRYTSPDAEVIYRLACFSRNLTGDRSWDTAIVLEGPLHEDRKVAFGPNRPLGDFIGMLPSLAVRGVSAEASARVTRFADELRKVAFVPPEGFDEYEFWPIGHDAKRSKVFSSIERATKALVVSPFVSTSQLAALADLAPDVRLVARADELDRINTEILGAFSAVSVLADAVEAEQATDAGSETSGALSGLHAKVYVVDHGWQSSILTGSANATRAAMECNVEFLLRLVGKRSVCGVDAVLTGGKGQNALGALLQPYSRVDAAVGEDSLAQQLEDEAGRAARVLATHMLTLRASEQEPGIYRLDVQRGAGDPVGSDLRLRCWPITLSEDQAAPFSPTGAIASTFADLSSEALTTFLAVSVTAARRGTSHTKRFVLNLPLEGGPTDRRERILRTVLRDRQRVLRFLLLLLGDLDALVSGELPLPGEGGSQSIRRGSGSPMALLEPLIRALHRDPIRLDQIARLVEELRVTEGEELLPEDFAPIWKTIWSAREAAR